MKNLIIALILPLTLLAQKQPKLIVGIVVDQMRYEMLDRYKNDFGPDGFNLLVDKGFRYDSCTFSYIPTFTAPGHATIYTGLTPSKHGILGNDIFIPQMGKTRYCVEDDTVYPIGSADENSRRSPKNLLANTFGDSLKMMDEKSKVIAMSLKDRGAVLPGGKLADAAYWFDKNGMMVTSSYYMDELPVWADSFNMDGYITNNMLAAWDLFQDKDVYNESLPDESPFESPHFDEANALPYNISQAIRTEGLGVLRETPYGNSLLTEFAIWALREEGLGFDKHTDLLAISYSSTDHIGHAFGPQSVEIQDTYLRLDKDLASLINVLDNEIGRNNYVLFLTSDHGVANTPADDQFSYVSNKELKESLNAFTTNEFGVALIKHVASQQIWLDQQLLINGKYNRNEIVQSLHQFMLKSKEPKFEAVFTKDQIAICKTGECLPFRKAFIPHLSGDLFYIRPYGQMERTTQHGTTHGSGYLYDTHVPLLFFGGNVKKGSSNKPVSVYEIKQILKGYLPGWEN